VRTTRTLAVLLMAFSGQTLAQSGGIAGVVVARSTGEALPYSIVEVEGTAFSVFADDSGRFTFRGVATGLHVLHIRRLGFTPADVSVQVLAGATDTLTVSLDHVAVQLGGVTVRAFPPCTTPGPPAASDSALTTIFGQLSLNARQYKYLAEHYPFDQIVEVHKTRKIRGSKDALLGEPLHNVTYHSADKRQYAPGGIVKRKGNNWYFEIPELIDVAEPAFINAHCWHYAGMDTIDDVEHFRVDIVAADTLPDADVNGSFYINSSVVPDPPQCAALLQAPERGEERGEHGDRDRIFRGAAVDSGDLQGALGSGDQPGVHLLGDVRGPAHRQHQVPQPQAGRRQALTAPRISFGGDSASRS